MWKQKGYFAWVLARNLDQPLCGYGVTNGDTLTATTHRSILSGIYAITLTVRGLAKEFGDGKLPYRSVPIWTENKEISTTLNAEDCLRKNTRMKLHTQADYDLTVNIHEITTKLGFPLHVLYGDQVPFHYHQTNLPDRKTLFKGLRDLIKSGSRKDITPPPLQHTPAETISFSTKEEKLTMKFDYWIRRIANGPALEEYLLQRNQWTKPTFQEIDWKAYELAISLKPAILQTNICKYVHGWQNVGKQKQFIDYNTQEAK